MLFSLTRRPATISRWSAFSNRLALRSVTTNASLTHPLHLCTTKSSSPSSPLSSPSSALLFRRSNNNRRSFSFGNEQLPPDDPQALFKPIPPTELNLEMAKGIQTANHLILKYGVGRQRLKLLSKDNDMPLVIKWQRMMEVYLGAQLHVVAALGYSTDESGIMMYTQQLGQFVGTKCTQDQQEEFRTVGRETWREMLTIAFDLDEELCEKYGKELSIVDARNIVHKVASRLIEPNILEEVATQVGKLPPQSDPNMEMGMKHSIIQDVVVNQVYLGGDPIALVEELGFGSGPKGYAMMQYVMAYHESDPLCQQYTATSMTKIWQSAGLDLGNANPAAVGKLPMSGP